MKWKYIGYDSVHKNDYLSDVMNYVNHKDQRRVSGQFLFDQSFFYKNQFQDHMITMAGIVFMRF